LRPVGWMPEKILTARQRIDPRRMHLDARAAVTACVRSRTVRPELSRSTFDLGSIDR
jgi:hypothetical protein